MDFIYKLPIIRNIDFEAFSIRMNEIDFEGQKTCEYLYKLIIRIFLVAAVCFSFYTQQMRHGVYLIILGTFFAVFVCAPSWPWFNKHPLKWLPHVKENKTEVHDNKNIEEIQQ